MDKWGQTNKTRADQLRDFNQAQELYERRQRMPREISDEMAKSVSEQRRDTLQMEAQGGYFREKGAMPEFVNGRMDFNTGTFIPTGFEETASARPDFSDITPAGFVKGKSFNKMASFNKLANFGSSSYGMGSNIGSAWRGSNDTGRQVPEVYSPLWLNSNLNLPRDRATINSWSRSFFALNPIVQNAISLHSTYPISKLNIKSKNRRVEKFFSDMIEEIDLMNICVQIAQEYWTLGESFVYAELDQSKGKWKRLLIQNPDYITVKRSAMAGEPMMSLKPDENLVRIVNSNKPSDIQQRKQLGPEIVDYIKKGANIPLNNFNVSHLARRIAPYEVRGTGLIVSCFRQLMLFDKLRESKYAQADNMVNPLTLVKIGSDEFRPGPLDLDAWRQVFEEAQYDKDFKIFASKDIEVERVGYGQGIYDISGDITQVIKEIYIGLMVPSVLMDGTDTTYANGSVALDVLRQRYMQFRNMLSQWLKRKIFAPISKIQGFYDYVEGEKTLIVPEVDWNHMSLFDMDSYTDKMMQLAQGQPGQPGTSRVSVQTLYRSLGLEYEDELRKMRYEDIQENIRIKENQSLMQYSLSELRALTPEDEIEEVVQPALPGENPFVGQQDPNQQGGGMPGAPGGGMPGGMPGGPPRPPMGAGGGGPKGPGGGPKPPGGPPGGSPGGPTGGGSPPGGPPPPS